MRPLGLISTCHDVAARKNVFLCGLKCNRVGHNEASRTDLDLRSAKQLLDIRFLTCAVQNSRTLMKTVFFIRFFYIDLSLSILKHFLMDYFSSMI